MNARPRRGPSLETVGMSKTFGALARARQRLDQGARRARFMRCSARTAPASRRWSNASWVSMSPDKGQLLLDGAEAQVRNPRDAQALGVGMVYQHFTLAPALTAAENLVVSRADAPSRHQLARRAPRARSVPRNDAVPRAARPAGVVAGGGREAEARNPEAALSQPALPHPRRADLGADAGRGRRDSRAVARHDPARRDHGDDDLATSSARSRRSATRSRCCGAAPRSARARSASSRRARWRR